MPNRGGTASPARPARRGIANAIQTANRAVHPPPSLFLAAAPIGAGVQPWARRGRDTAGQRLTISTAKPLTSARRYGVPAARSCSSTGPGVARGSEGWKT